MLSNEMDNFLEEVLLRQETKAELTQLVDGYRLTARAEGKSENYISLVSSSIRFLTHFLSQNGFPTDVTKIEPQHLRKFVVHLQSTPRFAAHPFTKTQHNKLSRHTINAYMRSIRAFWSWLDAEEIIEQNPFSRVKVPKAPKKVIPTFSEQQIRDLLAQPDTSSPGGFRNYVIMLTLLDTMMRISELTGARLEDLDLEGRCVKIWGKGNKQRVVPFGKTVQRSLWRYLKFFRPEPQIPRQDNVFLSFDGRPMTKNRIQAILKSYGGRAGTRGVRVSPHTFRHTGAVSFLRNGGDLFSLQRIMGHASLEVLRGYVNLHQGDVDRVHANASPLDNLGLPTPKTRRYKK